MMCIAYICSEVCFMVYIFTYMNAMYKTLNINTYVTCYKFVLYRYIFYIGIYIICVWYNIIYIICLSTRINVQHIWIYMHTMNIMHGYMHVTYYMPYPLYLYYVFA